MKVFHTVRELDLPWGNPIGFVPTMGALHEGHLSLIRRAKEVTGYAVVSIFVNPTQFGPNEDFTRYPRPLERDLELAKAAGADAVLVPEVEDLYGPDQVWVRVDGVTELWEGEWRPGHFEGVATIVAKLFNIVRPTDAFFGTKDLQQCAVVESMIRGLKMPIRFHREPTYREPDGLALSSRNRYLSEQERGIAVNIPRTLQAALRDIEGGKPLAQVLEERRFELEHAGFDVQYLAYVDSTTLAPLKHFRPAGRAIVAAKLGATRLIDNLGHGESF